MASDLMQFAENLRQEVNNEARLEGAETMRAEAFTASMILELSEAGELDDGQVASYKSRGVEVSGYSVGDDGLRLDLLLTIHTQTVPAVTVTREQVETGFARLLGFFERARGDLVNSLEESTPAFDMALTVRDLRELEKVRLFIHHRRADHGQGAYLRDPGRDSDFLSHLGHCQAAPVRHLGPAARVDRHRLRREVRRTLAMPRRTSDVEPITRRTSLSSQGRCLQKSTTTSDYTAPREERPSLPPNQRQSESRHQEHDPQRTRAVSRLQQWNLRDGLIRDR